MKKRFITSVYLGNIFEHYDTALYGLLSPFIADLFFPGDWKKEIALIAAYCLIPLGMIAKPLGSLFFGYVGDRFGRRVALFYALFGMGIVSSLIAFCPIYQDVGYWAPLFLMIARLAQSFLGAGEAMGGAIYLLEISPEKRHDLISSLFSASTIAGILIGSGAVSLLATTGVIYEKWRLLYLFGGVTALFGCAIRGKGELEERKTLTPLSFKENFYSLWKSWRAFIQVAVVAGFSYSCYSVALVMTNGFIPMITSLTKAEVINMNTALLVFDFALLPVFGYCASRYSREKLMLIASGLVVVSAIPLFLWLEGASMLICAIVRVCFVIIGVCFSASLHSWCQGIVPKENRYTLISVAYAVGSQLLGAPTAAISLWFYHETRLCYTAAFYWVLLAILTFSIIFYNNINTRRLRFN